MTEEQEYKLDCMAWLLAEFLYKQRIMLAQKILSDPAVQKALAERIAEGSSGL
jgi:hypothetical protein